MNIILGVDGHKLKAVHAYFRWMGILMEKSVLKPSMKTIKQQCYLQLAFTVVLTTHKLIQNCPLFIFLPTRLRKPKIQCSKTKLFKNLGNEKYVL